MNIRQARLFIEKYASGEYDREMHRLFTAWLRQASAEEINEIASDARQLFKHDKQNEKLADLFDTGELENRLGKYFSIGEPIVKEDGRLLSLRKKRFLLAAAVIGLLILGSAGYYGINHIVKRKAIRLVYKETIIPFGKVGTLQLEDGTKVTLNSGSTLRYPQHFEGGSREVFLDGEGYFEVAHDENHPFVIHSNSLRTKVLGTSLDVSAYGNEEQVSVVVLSGKVSVKDTLSGRSAILIPHEKIILNTHTSSWKASRVDDLERIISWQKGKVVFDDTPLHDVLERLSGKYGMRLVLGDSALEAGRITVSFQHETLKKALKVITALTDTRYRRIGSDTIELIR